MNNQENMTVKSNSSTSGTLLYVTELDDDSSESFDLAFELAVSTGTGLEMIHVVDLNHARPGPDGQMEIQFRLDALARSLRHLNRSFTSVLMFGSPEDVVTRRAREINAKLIAFPSHGQRLAAAQVAMVKRVGNNVACPVVVLNAPGTSALED
jgi:nucleotide-binding universal stress UspA family protein